MKLTIALYTTTVSAFILSGSNALVSPSVTCCSDNGGTYEIVKGSDGESGVCVKDGVYYDEMTFMQDNCPPPSPSPSPTPSSPPSKYSVYAVNNCDNTVSAEFVLATSAHGGNRKSSVDSLQVGNCAYVGSTDQDTVTFTSEGSFVSGGNDSCKNIRSSNDSECNLLGIASNACVVTLC